MTIIIVILIILGLATLRFVLDQKTFERYIAVVWNAVGKPAVNHFFVTTDKN